MCQLYQEINTTPLDKLFERINKQDKEIEKLKDKMSRLEKKHIARDAALVEKLKNFHKHVKNYVSKYLFKQSELEKRVDISSQNWIEFKYHLNEINNCKAHYTCPCPSKDCRPPNYSRPFVDRLII